MISLLTLATSVLCVDVTWKQETGNLKQIQVDPHYEIVCGTTASEDVFCSKTDTIAWYNAPGKLTQVSVANGIMFGVSKDSNVYYSPSAEDGKIAWTQLKGGLSQISTDGTTVCGTITNELYCAYEAISTAPVWTRLPGKFTQIVVRGQKLYGVNSNNELWYSATIQNPAWVRLISGPFRQIDFDGSVLCGTNSKDEVYCADQKLDTEPNWERLSGELSVVSVAAGGQIFGTSSNSLIYSSKFGVTNIDLEDTDPMPPNDPLTDISSNATAPSRVRKLNGSQRKPIMYYIVSGVSKLINYGTKFYENHIDIDPLNPRQVPTNSVIVEGQDIDLKVVGLPFLGPNGGWQVHLQSVNQVWLDIYTNYGTGGYTTSRIVDFVAYDNPSRYTIVHFGPPKP